MSSNDVAQQDEQSGARTRLQGPVYWVVLSLGVLGLLMAINQTFTLRAFGFQPLGNSFLYYLIGLFLAVAFLNLPRHEGLR